VKVFESLKIVEKFENPVITIGNYDGFHLGHQKIIERVKEEAKVFSGTSMLMTFDPHPLSFLKPERFLGLLTPMHLKKRLIEGSGVDVLIVVPFTKEFRLVTAEAFVRDILIRTLNIKGLIVGYDFTFGKDGWGNVLLLQHLSEEYGFYFEFIGAIEIDGKKVGSNQIRKLIRKGETEKAKKFLGRPYMMEGRVTKGEGRGTDLGFPTVNLETDFELIPKNGVYVSEVEVDGKRYQSLTNVGDRPTFGEKKLSIESHILDFHDNLYGKEVTIYFHQYLRDEKKFSSIAGLQKEISNDIENARRYFNRLQYREVYK